MAAVAKLRGNAAFYAGEFTEAIRHFTDAVKLSPTDHILYSNRSAAYTSLCNYSQALTDAKQTVELKPDWAKGYSRLGEAHMGLHNFNDAVQAYKQGLEIDPTNEALKSALSDAQSAAAANLSTILLSSVSYPVNGPLRISCSCPHHTNIMNTCNVCGGKQDPPSPPPGQRNYESEQNPFQARGCTSKYDVQEDSATAIMRVDMPGIGINDLTMKFEEEGENEFMVIDWS